MTHLNFNQNDQSILSEDDDGYEYNLGHINFNSGHTANCNWVTQHIHNYAAIAVWVFASSQPKGFKLNQKHVCREIQMGVATYKKAIAYLKDLKLIVRTQRREVGKFLPADTDIDNGINFVPQCNHENCIRFRNHNNSNTDQDLMALKHASRPTPPKFKESTVGQNLTHGETPTVGHFLADGKTTHIDKNKLLNKTTTTRSDLERSDHPIKGDLVRSSSEFCIDPLREYGFGDIHEKQLANMNLQVAVIQESIENYAKALKDPKFRANIKSGYTNYFMGIMRKSGHFSAIESVEKIEINHERQQQTQRSIEMSMNTDRYADHTETCFVSTLQYGKNTQSKPLSDEVQSHLKNIYQTLGIRKPSGETGCA